MTLDQLNARDRRIAELEALGSAGRTLAQQRELGLALAARDTFWRRLPDALATTRRRAETLEFYARQIGLPLEMETANA